MSKIVARAAEQHTLEEIYLSKNAEFVAVYGRRRIGKTYLIKHYFQTKKCVYFHVTGIRNATLNIQLERFGKVLAETFYPGLLLKSPTSWMEAFEQLTTTIEKLLKTKKVILFFDEFP